MAKYIKKPIEVEATRWFTNGDHPKDDCRLITSKGKNEEKFLSEGKVVRYFRHPEVKGKKICKHCDVEMLLHGWIDTLEGGHIVCPGDWIVTGVKGEYYPVKNSIFRETYDKEEK